MSLPQLVLENHRVERTVIRPNPVAAAVQAAFRRRVLRTVAIEHIYNAKGRLVAERAVVLS